MQFQGLYKTRYINFCEKCFFLNLLSNLNIFVLNYRNLNWQTYFHVFVNIGKSDTESRFFFAMSHRNLCLKLIKGWHKEGISYRKCDVTISLLMELYIRRIETSHRWTVCTILSLLNQVQWRTYIGEESLPESYKMSTPCCKVGLTGAESSRGNVTFYSSCAWPLASRWLIYKIPYYWIVQVPK